MSFHHAGPFGLALASGEPAPLCLDGQPERHRRVRCIWLVKGSRYVPRLSSPESPNEAQGAVVMALV
jgi:hypothetical protein